MAKTSKASRRHAGKIIGIGASAVLLLLALELLASNYLVTFAVARRAPETGSEVVPESTTTDAVQQKADENAKQLSEQTQSWLSDAAVEQVEITSDDGLKLVGDIVMQKEQSHKWTIVVHGYSAQRKWMYDFADMWAEKGYNVLLPDLRGHGESEGDYVGMGWLDRKDMLHWIDLICERDPDAQIILHGVSMGGATVMMTAGEDLPQQVKAVVDDCGYTAVWDIFSDEMDALFKLPDFPLLYTASAISKLRAGYSFREASTLEQVKNARVPIMFIHGSNDNFVHTEMVYELYDTCPTQKDLYVVEGAGHGQSYYLEPEAYTEKVFAFLESIPQT